MNIGIKLNDMSYRYDVFQIVNLFHTFDQIDFVQEDYKYFIDIENAYMKIGSEHNIKTYEFNSKLSLKDQIKKYIYDFLSTIYGVKLPWGTLIGIRPSKIALSLIDKDYSEKDIIEYFDEHYSASADKARLCINVAKYEKNFVNHQSNNISIYIGMPFCPTRCLYCSFASNPIGPNKKLVEPYLNALKYEIEEMKEFIQRENIQIESIYFGGGTPTAIDDNQFEDLMEYIYDRFLRNSNIKEFTVECGRPDSISLNKLKSMKKYGVDRISINPQTMNNDTLKSIGRNHSLEDIIDKFSLARFMGFDNINMDIIVGLPGENILNINKTCEEIFKLAPDSLTVHGMSIKRASRLYEDLCLQKKYTIASQKELNEMYECTKALADSLNMLPYYMYRQKNMVGNMENVGYAIKGKEGIYNIQMIEERQSIIALGADAVSKIVFLDENRIERFPNLKDLREYINRIEEMVEKKKSFLRALY